MKKTIFITLILCLFLTGCYLIPLETPTPEPATSDGAQASATNTLVPAFTDTAAPESTATFTGTPARTSTPSHTPTAQETSTSTPVNTPVPFALQADSPVYIQNFVHTEAGCDWLGIAGQVFGEDDSPQINLVLVVQGTLGQTSIDMTGVTGVPEAHVYGPGGYEIILADMPVETDQMLAIQVFDLNGIAQSEPVVFDTYADCDKNLVIINFQAQ